MAVGKPDLRAGGICAVTEGLTNPAKPEILAMLPLLRQYPGAGRRQRLPTLPAAIQGSPRRLGLPDRCIGEHVAYQRNRLNPVRVATACGMA